MAEILHDKPGVDDRGNKTRRIVFKLDVDSSPTPETHVISGFPGGIITTSTECDSGACSTTEAIEDDACWDNAFTACPADACGEIGFLIEVAELESNSHSVDEVLGVHLLRGENPLFACAAVDEHDIITLLGDNITQGLVVSASGVTPAGNIAFELVSTVDFAAADYTQVFEVIYTIK